MKLAYTWRTYHRTRKRYRRTNGWAHSKDELNFLMFLMVCGYYNMGLQKVNPSNAF